MVTRTRERRQVHPSGANPRAQVAPTAPPLDDVEVDDEIDVDELEDGDEFDTDDDLETDDDAYVPGVVRATPWIIAITGAIGFLAAFILSVERFLLLANPDYTPTCSINSAISCGTVMTSAAGTLFGFPNPLLGIAGFAILTTSGMAMVAGGRMASWYWTGLQIGATLAIVFVHWLMYQSLVVIQALCPYCMVVWAVTIIAFWAITLRNIYAIREARGVPDPGNTAVINYAPAWLTAWLVTVAVVVVSAVVLV